MKLFWLCFLLLSLATGTLADEERLRVAVTTSFQNSGLSDVLLPEFKKDTGITVDLLVVGTGQALRLGRAGDVDAVLVHSRPDEDAFVAEGYGTHRREIMYNDFVIIGPGDDPAGAGQAVDAATAFAAIRDAEALFISRGDESGTHKREVAIWTSAELDPETFETWYRSAGSGMGAALNMASAVGAYILSDRSSWLNFGNKGQLRILFEGDSVLLNRYALLPVHPDRHPHVNSAGVDAFERWLAGEPGQSLIGSYRIGGESVFTPSAEPRN